MVDIKDRSRVEELLLKNGYIKDENEDFHEFHWRYRKEKVIYELHWGVPGVPINDETIESYVSDIIDKRELISDSENCFFVPSTYHHGLVLLLHTASHLPSAGLGMRQLCDWLVFQSSFSEESFIAMFSKPLQDIGLWYLAKVMTKIGFMYFGCGGQNWYMDVDDSICTALLEDVLAGGNFSIKEKGRESQVMLIQNKKTKKVSKGDILRNAALSVNKKAIRVLTDQ